MLPRQTILACGLASFCEAEIRNLIESDALVRLWAKDGALWPPGASSLDIRKGALGWLDLPREIGPRMERVRQRVREAKSEGIENFVLLAQGSSNLAADTLLRHAPPQVGDRFLVLDSVAPDAIRAVEEMVDLRRTLFVLASQSGRRIEIHALLLYFLSKLKSVGVTQPGNHFAAVTSEGSYLAALASEYKFREQLADPPGLLGPYASLLHFGLLLSAFWGANPGELISQAEAMRRICSPEAKTETNPALQLAAFLASGMLQRHDRMLLLSPKSICPAMILLAQLLGYSTGKDCGGIVPVFHSRNASLDIYKQGCMAAVFQLTGDADEELSEAVSQFEQSGVPLVKVAIDNVADLGPEFFKWQVATALACSLLEINPFAAPDAAAARSRTLELLDHAEGRREWPQSRVRVHEPGIALFAEGTTRQSISTLSLEEALRTFWEMRQEDGYLAVLSFLGPEAGLNEELEAMCGLLASRLEIPAFPVNGTRYLYSLGQLYKGGPENGLFLMLTCDARHEIAVPGANYTFGQLHLARALGDFEALTGKDRPILRLHLAQDPLDGLKRLNLVVMNSLGRQRGAVS